MLSLLALLAPLALSAAVQQVEDDPVQALRSKDPAQREAAVLELAGGEVRGEAELAKAVTKDRDVRVVLAAIDALRGWAEAWSGAEAEPSKWTLKALQEAALESPFARVRRSAAVAALRIDPDGSRAAFAKKASGKTFARAAEALAFGYEALESVPAPDKKFEKDARKVAKGEKSKREQDRVLALRATVALGRSDPGLRAEALARIGEELLDERKAAPGICAMLESVAAAPTAADAEALLVLLQRERLTTVVERRLEQALAGALGALSHEERLQRVGALIDAAEAPYGPRLARVLASLDPPAPLHLESLRLMLRNGDGPTRAAAARGLGAYGTDGAEIARREIGGAKGGRSQLQLVRVLERHAVIGVEENAPSPAASALLEILDGSGAVRVQSAAAVALGRPEQHSDVTAALGRFASDPERSVPARVAAAIALGRTRDAEGAAVLDALGRDEDWELRAAAAEGLKQLSGPASVPTLLALLDDETPTVRVTAHHALLRLSGRERSKVDPATWPEWWEKNLKRARFTTREEQKARRDKYGYRVAPEEIYKGLDVIVVQSSTIGDNVDKVLARLGIEHRTVRAGKVAELGLHPGALLLVGCTGQVSPEDLEAIRWYVNAGGALFSSCWALTYTVEASFPAILARFPSPGEVVDNVFAYPTATGLASPFLKGVFEGGVQPFYALQGAHLLRIVDPERAEVLLDSPSAAARHGTGDLAAWFRVGHGLVVNSANHFEEQGFRSAPGLDGPLERQAFAVNHMGYTPLELRASQKEKWWSKTGSAAAEVNDLSVFRILTNFARKKRIDG
ncbi:MAG: HEAT repeat domain-containing protein [Planctomycetota bacterium]